MLWQRAVPPFSTSACLCSDVDVLQGSNDLQLERMNVYFNEASGGENWQKIQCACLGHCTSTTCRSSHGDKGRYQMSQAEAEAVLTDVALVQWQQPDQPKHTAALR